MRHPLPCETVDSFKIYVYLVIHRVHFVSKKKQHSCQFFCGCVNTLIESLMLEGVIPDLTQCSSVL